MIASKLRAYNYKDGEWETISRWQLARLSELEYKKFKENNFPLYIRKDTSSFRLTYNQKQKTFRFYPGEVPENKKGSNGLTIAHQIAQEVISDLRLLNLKLTDKRFKPYKKVEFKIEADQIFQEFRTTANDSEYIVDLMIVFSKPAWLAIKWNRILILEVYVTNDVRGRKIIDFEKKGLSLAEVVIGSKFKSNKSASKVTESEEEELRQRMKYAFTKQIFGDLWIDTSTSKYLENQALQERDDEILIIRKSLENSQNEINSLNQALEQKERQVKSLSRNFREIESTFQREIVEKKSLKKELDAQNSKSKFQLLVDLIKK